MLDALTKDAVEIVGYRERKLPDGKPKTWKGTEIPMEDVQFTVDGEQRYRSTLLDKSVNGSRADVGQKVRLVIRTEPFQSIAKRRDGTEYIRTNYPDKIVGMEVVSPAKG